MHETGVHIVRTAARSHPGMIRPYQEDAVLIGWNTGGESWNWQSATSSDTMPDGGVLLAVADGMGGLNAGDVASGIAVEEVKKNFSHFGKVDETQAVVLLRQAVINAHHAIENESKKPENGEMGSTLVIAWLLGENLHVTWVGDSRCYRFRRNEGLKLLTKDHSLVQDLLDEGAITESQAFDHPQRNVITQSLGIHGRDPEPDCASFALLPGDLLLLCSDGLNTMLTDEEIASVCEKSSSLEQCVEALITAANEAGGHDNISVVLAMLDDGNSLNHVQKTIPPVLSVSPKKTDGKKPVPRLFWLMLPLVAVLIALTTWVVMQKEMRSSGEPVSTEIPAPDTLSEPVISPEEKKEDSTANEASLAVDSLPVPNSRRTGDYVLIANSFARQNEAEVLFRKLKNRYPDAALLIEKNNGLYEVRITGFLSGKEADDFHQGDPDLARRVVLLISTETEKID